MTTEIGLRKYNIDQNTLREEPRPHLQWYWYIPEFRLQFVDIWRFSARKINEKNYVENLSRHCMVGYSLACNKPT